MAIAENELARPIVGLSRERLVGQTEDAVAVRWTVIRISYSGLADDAKLPLLTPLLLNSKAITPGVPSGFPDLKHLTAFRWTGQA